MNIIEKLFHIHDYTSIGVCYRKVMDFSYDSPYFYIYIYNALYCSNCGKIKFIKCSSYTTSDGDIYKFIKWLDNNNILEKSKFVANYFRRGAKDV